MRMRAALGDSLLSFSNIRKYDFQRASRIAMSALTHSNPRPTNRHRWMPGNRVHPTMHFYTPNVEITLSTFIAFRQKSAGDQFGVTQAEMRSLR